MANGDNIKYEVEVFWLHDLTPSVYWASGYSLDAENAVYTVVLAGGEISIINFDQVASISITKYEDETP